ncbi:MAG: hypothetical protein HOW97_08130 [Catenulispora sp.]|nr:hypothetical protein [Catenulispora sp.]
MAGQPRDVLPDDRPSTCPECGSTTFDYDPAYNDGCSSAPAWLCTGCKWGMRAYPNGVRQ